MDFHLAPTGFDTADGTADRPYRTISAVALVAQPVDTLAACLGVNLAVTAPTKLIFDTDIGNDCDDAGTLALIHAFIDRGEVDLLAVMISTLVLTGAACADAINTYYRRPDIPIGVGKTADNTQTLDDYATYIAQRYPHDIVPGQEPDAVKLYRQILAAQPDHSVVIAVVGPATNIGHLLDSPPDEVSPLDGVALVAQKVKFYSAGGNGRANLPSGEAGWNYKWDLAAAANELKKMPTTIPFVFAGGSGLTLFTGGGYEQKPEGHIIRVCYEQHQRRKTNLARCSWDQLRVWYAVRGGDNFDTSPPGDVTVVDDNIRYSPTPNRNRCYAYVKDKALAAAQLEELMMHEPEVDQNAGIAGGQVEAGLRGDDRRADRRW